MAMRNRLTIDAGGAAIVQKMMVELEPIGAPGWCELYSGPFPDDCNTPLARSNVLLATAMVEWAPATRGGLAFSLKPTSDVVVNIRPTFLRFYTGDNVLAFQVDAEELDLSEIYSQVTP